MGWERTLPLLLHCHYTENLSVLTSLSIVATCLLPYVCKRKQAERSFARTITAFTLKSHLQVKATNRAVYERISRITSV